LFWRDFQWKVGGLGASSTGIRLSQADERMADSNSDRIKLWGAIVLIAAAGGWAGYQLFRPGPLPSDVSFVCVETGEFFAIDREDVLRLPVENPKTGRRTLLPCSTGPDGTVYVGDRYRGTLERIAGDLNNYVDPDTLAVQTTEGT
jgi:hypothetical protein